MTNFDPIKAAREELKGFADVHRLILARARDAERRLAEAEADCNALRLMEAFMKGMLDTTLAKLRALETEALQQ